MKITATAERLCGPVDPSGREHNSKIEGDIKGELGILRKRLGNLGLFGTGVLGSSEYEGVVREQLAIALQDARECKAKIFDMLQKKLIPNTSDQERRSMRNPNALYQYDEKVAEVQGAVISQANGVVTFQAIRTAGKADPAREVEYQDWVLRCPNLPKPHPDVIIGQFIGVIAGAVCDIFRKSN